MEARFGHDFSRVRVHTDPTAARSARAVHALAYTVGSDIAFDAGRYAPDTGAGRRLLAHELAHVVQQRTTTGSVPTAAALTVSEETEPAEAEAANAATLDEAQVGDVPPGLIREQPRQAVGPTLHRQAADVPLRIDAAPGDCSTRCGGIPAGCPPSFCCPFPRGTALLIRQAIMSSFLTAIGLKVTASVVPVWSTWFLGGASLQDFSPAFAPDFAADAETNRVSRLLRASLIAELDPLALGRLAIASAPGMSVSLLPALPPDYLATRSGRLEAPGTLRMNFTGIGTVPGNLAGGIGKTQRTCSVGATPSTVEDARQVTDVVATLVRSASGAITVTPSFTYHVVDTVDLCPGDCGSSKGLINEQQATVPMSRLEASGVSGDVPFFVDFTTTPMSPLTISPPAPPAPTKVTVSGSTLFDFGSDQLRPGGEAALLAQLGDRPVHADLSQAFLIEGHTDSRGSDAVNQPLSERRARRVAEVLERNFPNLVGHTTTTGVGASNPVAPNTIGGADNPAGRELNRRVEIHFTAPPP
jgi:outer membrane protein OmpA-like peptidoglycan-associated protein